VALNEPLPRASVTVALLCVPSPQAMTTVWVSAEPASVKLPVMVIEPFSLMTA
jgi:hypothetical protein